MNPELTDEQIRVAIAEACGWRKLLVHNAPWQGLNSERRCEPPDYLNDLQAMHEAEKILNPGKELSWYEEHLKRIVFAETSDVHWFDKCGGSIETKFFHATARQRALALYATIKPQEGREKL